MSVCAHVHVHRWLKAVYWDLEARLIHYTYANLRNQYVREDIEDQQEDPDHDEYGDTRNPDDQHEENRHPEEDITDACILLTTALGPGLPKLGVAQTRELLRLEAPQ